MSDESSSDPSAPAPDRRDPGEAGPSSQPPTEPPPPPEAIVSDPHDESSPPPPPPGPTAHEPPPPPPPADHPAPADPAGSDPAGVGPVVAPDGSPRGGFAAGLVPIGSGLLGAAALVSATRARSDGELDWSTYLVGLAATAALLVLSVLGAAAAGRRLGGKARSDVVTWPGVVGILATAAMIDVGLDVDERWVGYLIGGVITGLAVVGFAVTRRAAFVVTAIVGLGVIYALVFDDLFAEMLDEEHGILVLAAAVAVFVVVVTVLGSLLPTRNVSGVAVGVAGVVGMVGLLSWLVLTRMLSDVFGSITGQMDLPDFGGAPDAEGTMGMAGPTGFAESDVWWVLAFAAVLTAMWAVAAVASNHSGYSILAIVMPLLTVPLAAVALAVEHPTWWSAALAAGGGVLVLASAGLAKRRGTPREPVVGTGG